MSAAMCANALTLANSQAISANISFTEPTMLTSTSPTPNTHHTEHSSAQALDALGNKGVGKRDSEIFNIVLGANRNGIADLSGREIQQRYEFQTSRRIDTSTISGCISRLVCAKRLERTPARSCSITGFNIVPVRAVVQQTRLVA